MTVAAIPAFKEERTLAVAKFSLDPWESGVGLSSANHPYREDSIRKAYSIVANAVVYDSGDSSDGASSG